MTIPARIRCCFLEPAAAVRISLRRLDMAYGGCSARKGESCRASALVGEVPLVYADESRGHLAAHPVDQADPRWPTRCASCGREFVPQDHFIVDQDVVYRRADNGALMTLDEAPVGAMWFAPWYSDVFHGFDGKCLVVRIPERDDWIVDSRASNCTLPKDDKHRCWIRHGAPPKVTVNKNGPTCKAGGGSILTPEYHGHLTNGELVKCS